jgi:hypothetical protein
MLSNLWKYSLAALTAIVATVMFSGNAGAFTCNSNDYQIYDSDLASGYRHIGGDIIPNTETVHYYNAQSGQKLWIAVEGLLAGTTLKVYKSGDAVPIREYDSSNTPSIGNYIDENGDEQDLTISVVANATYCFVSKAGSEGGQTLFRVFDTKSHATVELPKESTAFEYMYDSTLGIVLPRTFIYSTESGNSQNMSLYGFSFWAKDPAANVRRIEIFAYDMDSKVLASPGNEPVSMNPGRTSPNNKVITAPQLNKRDFFIIVTIPQVGAVTNPIEPHFFALDTQLGGALSTNWVSIADCLGPSCSKTFSLIANYVNPRIHYMNRATTATLIHVLNNSGIIIHTQSIASGANPQEYLVPSLNIGYQVVLTAQAASTHLLKLK